MTLFFVVSAAVLVCIGVGYTCYRIGVSTGWIEAEEYFDAREASRENRARNEPESPAE